MASLNGGVEYRFWILSIWIQRIKRWLWAGLRPVLIWLTWVKGIRLLRPNRFRAVRWILFSYFFIFKVRCSCVSIMRALTSSSIAFNIKIYNLCLLIVMGRFSLLWTCLWCKISSWKSFNKRVAIILARVWKVEVLFILNLFLWSKACRHH